MLEIIDQLSFKFLLFVHTILGVHGLPVEHSPDWKILENWVGEQRGHQRLVLESDTVSEKCRKDQTLYVLFPQNYMGKEEVYADDMLVYTNSVAGDWDLATIFDRPAISCKSFVSAKKIKFVVTSFFSYYSSINSYPKLSNGRPITQFLYSEIYLVSAAICIALSIIGEILIRLLNPSVTRFNFTLLGFFTSLLMMTHVPGYFLNLNIRVNHTLIYFGILTMGFTFMYEKLKEYLSEKQMYALAAIIIITSFLTTINTNLAQVIMIFGCMITIFAAAFITFFYKKMSSAERFLHVAIVIICMSDFYRSQAGRNGTIHLSILGIVLVVTAFLAVIKEVIKKNDELLSVDAKLKNEKILVEKVTSLNEVHRQIIHDLKAPITSLDFIIKSNRIDFNILGVVNSRLSEILNKASNPGSSFSLDWYTVDLLFKNIEEIRSSIMSSSNVNIKLEILNFGNALDEVFFDPVDLKSIFEEIFLNSIKYNKVEQKKFFFSVKNKSEDHITFEMRENGKRIDDNIFKSLGQKGITTGGTGFGIYGIKAKLVGWGGSLNILNSDEGIVFIFDLKCRVSGSF